MKVHMGTQAWAQPHDFGIEMGMQKFYHCITYDLQPHFIFILFFPKFLLVDQKSASIYVSVRLPVLFNFQISGTISPSLEKTTQKSATILFLNGNMIS